MAEEFRVYWANRFNLMDVTMIMLLLFSSALRVLLVDMTASRIPASIVEILRTWSIGGHVGYENTNGWPTTQPELGIVQLRLQGGVNGDGGPHYRDECPQSLMLDTLRCALGLTAIPLFLR